ncbi:LysM peptidoglycan-binding domain-containing protein [Gemmobacter nectariphilus]|uniref:LysM peptidoglycan-binding domain-containing protein n=1 Tax=Gemmobacter nectariphilus TaxID=220343 RepID=UPI000421BE80|nr:LysM peptidoglycan-binding domain-containing protein [Gemmobacter nectariphilus]
MTEKTGQSGVMLGAVAGGVAVVVAVLGWQFWPRDPRVPAVVSAPPPAAPAPAVPASAPQAPVATPPVASKPAPPSFDTFRLGDDGTAIVAGIGAGGPEVAIVIDGAEAARAPVDASGRFAAIFSLDAAAVPRMMVLRLILADGSTIDSADSVVIAPAILTTAAAEAPAEPPAPQATPDPAPAATAEPGTAQITAAPAPAATVPPAAAPEAAAVSVPQVPAEAPPPPLAAAPVAAPEPGAAPRPAPPAVASAPPQAPPAAEPAPVAAAPTPVPAPGAAQAKPANLLVSDAGVQVLRPAPDAALAIDSISYTERGAVQVAGKGGAGAFVRLYLNNAPQLDTLVDEAGAWRGTLPPVDPGLYTLRADLMDKAGKVQARSETPFLREAPEVLAAAGTGAGAAQVVTVQPGYTLWGIARRTYGAGILYVKVFEANKDQIRNPDLIYPGQVFALPQQD